MKLKYVNPGFDYMIEKIMEFQESDVSDYWSNPLYHFYPQIRKDYAAGLPADEKKKYIVDSLRKIYEEAEATIHKKLPLYQAYWDQHEKQISLGMTRQFGIDCDTILNDMVCNVTLNPICPRYLQDHSFDVFYFNSEKGALGMALHEIIHFVWFVLWNETFNDTYDQYELPSLKWILSEMVVDTIMSDEWLGSINPYFSKEKGGCVYDYFYSMKIGEDYILDVLDEMHRNNSISDFMKKSYSYCLDHEAEIRKHIAEAENPGE